MPLSPPAADLLTACLVTAGFLALHALRGFPSLTDAGSDNDSLMRMVEVRDLLAGQGWFDLTQYRMGPAGGFVMHWSRLVDAPIALIVLVAQWCGAGAETADLIACIVWPSLLYLICLLLILRIVRRLGDGAAMLPAVVAGAVALFSIGAFRPGAIDHHNAQLALLLALAWFMTDRRRTFGAGAGAGICAALMLGVGMETLPCVAAAGVFFALRFAIFGQEERRGAAGFGIGLACAALGLTLATIAPSRWLAAQCDAFSFAQLAAAAVSGLGLAAVAFLPLANGSRARRFAALAIVAAALAGVAMALFPQCLAGPYGNFDPQLKSFWLDRVEEAQPFLRVLVAAPALAAGSYATPLLALALALVRCAQGRASRGYGAVTVLLLAVVVESLWQVRGSKFSVPLAAIVLALWIGRLRMRSQGGGTGAELKAASAWLLSMSIVWSFGVSMAVDAAAAMGDRDAAHLAMAAAAAGEEDCTRAGDYAALGRLPAAMVLAPSNLGAPILRYTNHRVLAGPYHRDVAGMRIALAALTAPSAEAEQIAREQGITLLAFCPGNDESRLLAELNPGGLMASLLKQQPPAWLVPVGRPGAALRIYRLTADPASAAR